ncbi:1-phosphofructokinase [Alcaligenaceae bacterium C4P045]|nr:1-phosphofructokinase [Alcaligenaceae bacterium C4P045]
MARMLTVTLNPAIDMTMTVSALIPGEVHRVREVATHAAGKGINVAQALGDLGHTLTVTGFLGRDNAAMFEQLFARRGWRDAFIRVPGETRCNVKVVERRAPAEGPIDNVDHVAAVRAHADDGAPAMPGDLPTQGRNTDLNSPGFEVDARQAAQLADELCALAPDHDAIVFAGSLPRGIDAAWLTTLLARLKPLNPHIAVDTSGAALAAVLATHPWLVKPNVEELVAALRLPTHDRAAWQTAAARLVHDGVANVVVSDGAAGVTWLTAAGGWHAVPPKVDVRSTVGAGDTLLAGMVHALTQRLPPQDTLRLAAACGTYAVTQVGFGLPDIPALHRIEHNVVVSAIDSTPSTTWTRQP